MNERSGTQNRTSMQSSIEWCKHQRNILTHPEQSQKTIPAQEYTYPERKRNASGGHGLVVGKTEAKVPGTFRSALGRTEVRSADKR